MEVEVSQTHEDADMIDNRADTLDSNKATGDGNKDTSLSVQLTTDEDAKHPFEERAL